MTPPAQSGHIYGALAYRKGGSRLIYRMSEHEGHLSINELQKAIQGEYQAILRGRGLQQLAPPDHRTYFDRVVEEERQGRLAELTRLYYAHTGCYPVFEKVETPRDYLPGLKGCVDDALDSAWNYSDLMLSAKDLKVQKLMLRAMNSEMRWVSRLQFLYSNYFHENGDIMHNKGMIGIVNKQLPPAT